MNDYILSCCSTADLTKEHFLSRGINYICFHFNMNGVTYPDDLGESISFEDFYAAVKELCNGNFFAVALSCLVNTVCQYFKNGLPTALDAVGAEYNSRALADTVRSL